MSHEQQEYTILGRAWIAPAGTHSRFGNANNYTANSKVSCDVHVTALSAADGKPVDPTMTKVQAELPNWLRYVLYSAGNTDELSELLPSRIEVNVAIGVHTRRCVTIDVEAVTAELLPYRDAAVDEWKHSEAALAGLRNVLAAPKMGFKALKGLKGGLRELVTDVKSIGDSGPAADGAGPKSSYKPEEVESIRRHAVILGLRYQSRPNEYAQGRAAAVQAMPMYVQMLTTGAIHPDDFEVELMRHLTAGALTQQEADEYHRQAFPQASPPPPPPPPPTQ